MKGDFGDFSMIGHPMIGRNWRAPTPKPVENDHGQIQVQNKEFASLVAQLRCEGVKFDAERFDNNSWIIKLR